ncbi:MULTISPECIES: MATE family efflux transporter [unclassified Acinetobacter]|uniref:MATE family efflux transporter n=1 Tax=unclassified Acinetobacter TaxID=196816 RepID=UPI0035B6F60A
MNDFTESTMQPQKKSISQELKILLSLMLPILITQFAQAGFGLIDTIMAGHISAADLAAISVAVGMWFPILVLSSGIMLATSPLIAEAVGAKKNHDIQTITHQSLWIALILGIIAGAILFCMPLAFDALDIPANLHTKSGLFLQSIAFGMPAVALYTALRGYTEALGHPKVITIISIASLFLLIPINYIFMHGKLGLPAFGGAGAGFANAIMQWLILIALVIFLKKSKAFDTVRLFQKFELPDSRWLKRIFLLGFPIGLSIFFEVSIFSTSSLVISPLGDTFIAAHQIAMSTTGQLFMVPLSLAIALTIRVGQYYGAKDWQNLIQVQKIGFAVASVFACITMILLWFGREFILQAFTSDTAVIQVAFGLLVFAVMYQLMDAWQITASGCLRGLQETKAPMYITFIAYWIIAFPVGVYCTRYAGFAAKGVWIGLIVGLSVACVLLIWQLRKRNLQLLAIDKT